MLANTDGVVVRHVADLNNCPELLAHWADVIVLSRLMTEFPQNHRLIIENLKNVKAKLVVDIDDHWILPKGHPNEAVWKQSRTAQCINETIQLADAVWTTTPSLKTIIGNITRVPVHIVKNGINPVYDIQWNDTEAKLPHSELMIGFSAAPNHYPDLIRLREPLAALGKQRGWRLVAMGANPNDHQHIINLLGCNRILFEAALPATNYASMYRGVDLMLAPLAHTAFNRHRSDLKLAEAAFSNTPILCENYGPYKGHQCVVKTWDTLADVVIGHLTTQPAILNNYRVTDKENHGTTEPDRIRLETLRRLVVPEMEVVKTIER